MKKVLLLALCALLSIGTAAAQNKSEKSQSVINIGGVSFYLHTVKSGDTLFSIAKLYDTKQEIIAQHNPTAVESLNEGMVLKIPTGATATDKMSDRKRSKIFDEHIVNQGETAYSIAKRYEISIAILTEDNPDIEITTLAVGQRLKIRKSEIGVSKEPEIKQELVEYKEALNSVSKKFQYHIVEKGDTFYGLSKRYNVDQEELKSINNIHGNDGLQLGAMIKIPVKEVIPATVIEVAHNVPAYKEPAKINMTTKHGQTINLSILLPLSDKSGSSFLEFYQGALIALEDFKREGRNVNVELYDTKRSDSEINDIIDDRAFKNSDIIVGPVYEDIATPVVKFAEDKNIAIVSPLASFEQLHSPVLYQLSPDNTAKYDKLKAFFAEDKNIIVISSAINDAEFTQELASILPSHHKIAYSKATPAMDIEHKLSSSKENIIVVLAKNEVNVDEILARLSSIQNNMLARSIPLSKISVVGTPRWTRFNNIDKELFFKLNFHFISSYYSDRNNNLVADFDRRYASAFNSLPSPYSYRGYDAVKLFVGASGDSGSLSDNLNNYPSNKLLSMPYKFHRGTGNTNVNKEWALVGYNHDYTIEIK